MLANRYNTYPSQTEVFHFQGCFGFPWLQLCVLIRSGDGGRSVCVELFSCWWETRRVWDLFFWEHFCVLMATRPTMYSKDYTTSIGVHKCHLFKWHCTQNQHLASLDRVSNKYVASNVIVWPYCCTINQIWCGKKWTKNGEKAFEKLEFMVPLTFTAVTKAAEKYWCC